MVQKAEFAFPRTVGVNAASWISGYHIQLSGARTARQDAISIGAITSAQFSGDGCFRSNKAS